jgi:hypothetical protein
MQAPLSVAATYTRPCTRKLRHSRDGFAHRRPSKHQAGACVQMRCGLPDCHKTGEAEEGFGFVSVAPTTAGRSRFRRQDRDSAIRQRPVVGTCRPAQPVVVLHTPGLAAPWRLGGADSLTRGLPVGDTGSISGACSGAADKGGRPPKAVTALSWAWSGKGAQQTPPPKWQRLAAQPMPSKNTINAAL